MKDKPTVASVAEGLQKLIREVRQLQTEVANLGGTLRGFTKDRAGLESWHTPILPPEVGGHRDAKAKTDDPRSAIELIRYQYADNANLEIPTRTLLAIAKELDGALRDIRAAKLDIKAIADDSDLREDFREWQKNQQ